jgi:hypothetical protein
MTIQQLKGEETRIWRRLTKTGHPIKVGKTDADKNASLLVEFVI